MKIIIIAALFGFSGFGAFAQKVDFTPAKQECFTAGKTVAWKYCVYSAQQGTNANLIYHLHGRNQSETVWNDTDYYTGLIQKYWEKNQIIPPKVVSVSFGPVWILAPRNSTSGSGLLEVFVSEVIPEIEAKLGKPASRLLLGESMGGQNALVLGLRTEGVFKQVISLCPPVYKYSPFSPASVVSDLIQRTGADPAILSMVKQLASSYVSNDQEWEEISPIHLLDFADPAKTAPMYISTALRDKYGNFEGSEFFAEKAQKLGFKTDWRPLYGAHCSVDTVSVANLLRN